MNFTRDVEQAHLIMGVLCRGDDLDTRLLRAMVIKGILEQIITNTVNLVNADLLAKTRGLRIIESIVPSEGRYVMPAGPL